MNYFLYAVLAVSLLLNLGAASIAGSHSALEVKYEIMLQAACQHKETLVDTLTRAEKPESFPADADVWEQAKQNVFNECRK